MFQLRTYVTRDGKNPFATWLDSLRDPKARLAVRRRLNRVGLGNLGDHKLCGGGIWELRLDTGPGYRIYFGLEGAVVVVLLCAGDKSSQQRDLRKAAESWKDWKERANER